MYETRKTAVMYKCLVVLQIEDWRGVVIRGRVLTQLQYGKWEQIDDRRLWVRSVCNC